MLNYSVAIRTLGTNPDMLRQELESVFAQTVAPEKVVVYIAKGYKIPDFRVATEVYVPVNKGMTTQRALQYRECPSELLLVLDDDVYLPPKSVEMLIDALVDGKYDCVSPDTFANHKMNLKGKIYSFLTNLSLPLRNSRYAFTIHSNGTLSYLSNPDDGIYESQSASGPCALWRKDALLAIDLQSEIWIDTLKFAYAEDQLTYYKLYANGGRLAMHYGTGIEHRDGRAARSGFRCSTDMFLTRAQAQYLIWHRTIYSPRRTWMSRQSAALSFWLKWLWLMPVHIAAGIALRDLRVPVYFVRGTIDGVRRARSEAFMQLPPYIIAKR